MESIWTEKYRPKDFNEFFGQELIVERVKALVEKKNLPNLLFAGPAGTGKSSLSLVIAKKLFGDSWRQNFLELNSSDERGIDVIRNKVKDFARTKAIGDVPFKIIFLDESDSLTKEAQQALRRTMESYTNSCRFILGCNFSSKLIDPIQSRCAVFRFKPLSKDELKKIMLKISKKESLEVNEKAVEAVINFSEGDVRKLVNALQSCSSKTKKIDENSVYDIMSTVNPGEIVKILDGAVKGNFLVARDKILSLMLERGLSGLDVVKQIQKAVWDLKVSDKSKVELVDKCGEIEFRIVEGSDEFLQIEALLASFLGKC